VRYVAIDTETTGLDFETCHVIEIGAIVEDTEHPELTFKQVPKFSYILEWPIYTGQAYAINMNARIFEQLAKCDRGKMTGEEKIAAGVIPMYKAGDFFYQFLKDNNVFQEKSKSITIAGKNVIGFDKRMLEKVPHFFDKVQFRHKAIDPGILYWNPLIDNQLPSLEDCKKRAGLEKIEVSHNALEDAWDVIQVLRPKYDYLKSNRPEEE
jgi:oligoribonuclease (3'-5' exoribonuclease)